jgi:hypothetical protein
MPDGSSLRLQLGLEGRVLTPTLAFGCESGSAALKPGMRDVQHGQLRHEDTYWRTLRLVLSEAA